MRAKRLRKLSPLQEKVYDQMISVLPEAISRCESPAQAELLESHIYRLRDGGLISDREYQSFLVDIKNVYTINNWALPTYLKGV